MFTENWFGFSSQRPLQQAAICTNGLTGRVVEVGCWEGRSTVALAHAVAPHVVHAVDTWNGSPGEESEVLAAERDVYATFLANIEELTIGNVKPYRMDWRTYFAGDDSPIRFLHIDAAHSYDEVRANIEAAVPLMAHGIICGDDAHDEEVMGAVYDVLGDDVKIRATLWIWRCRGDE